LTSQADSDDGANARNNGAKKIRGAAAKNHREKELREERERSRQEAKKKREGRAERRRVDGESSISINRCLLTPLLDSDPAEELPPPEAKTTEVAAQPLDPPSSQVATPDTPPPNPPPVSHKKGGRPPNARKGKLGKNQYTKDLQDSDNQSPARSQSRDVPRGDDNNTLSNHKGPAHEVKHGKSKGSGNSKITMTDMKKRVAAILDFISRTQLEMAGGDEPLPSGEKTAEKMMMHELAEGLHREGMPSIHVNGGKEEEAKQGEAGDATPAKEFKDLSCLEMMDVLTRQLVKWQKEFT
jgi:hypothetical protein